MRLMACRRTRLVLLQPVRPHFLTKQDCSAVCSVPRKANNARHDWPSSASMDSSFSAPVLHAAHQEPLKKDVVPAEAPCDQVARLWPELTSRLLQMQATAGREQRCHDAKIERVVLKGLWEPLANLQRGLVVRAVRTFITDDFAFQMQLPKGATGIIDEVDAGDVFVRFTEVLRREPDFSGNWITTDCFDALEMESRSAPSLGSSVPDPSGNSDGSGDLG